MNELSLDIELAVANHFGWRRNLIVPNVSWGLGLHECDLLIVTKSRYAIEVEIKTSRADLIRDKQKIHLHKSDKIKNLYFALPKSLEVDIEYVPSHAGIFIVDTKKYLTLLRKAISSPCARKLTEEEYLMAARLGAMRVWSLKRKKIEGCMKCGDKTSDT